MIRVVVVGCGTMGQLHARALRAAGAELYCADAEPAAARRFATAVGATPVADVAAAIDRGVDGAVVTTPTLTHTKVLAALIEAGIPSFCEKPLALTLDETRAVGDLADTRGVPVQIGFHRRCDPGYLRVRRAVRDGELGRLRIVRAGTHEAKPPMERASVAGNVLRDLQIHDFDAVRFVTGLEVAGVTTVAVDAAETDGADWNCAAVVSVLEMTDGSSAVVTGGRPSPPGYDARLEAYGSAGSIAAGLDARTPMRSAGDGAVPSYGGFFDRFADAYDAEMRAFAGVVAGAAENPCTWHDAYAAMEIAIAAERSAHGGGRVAVDSV